MDKISCYFFPKNSKIINKYSVLCTENINLHQIYTKYVEILSTTVLCIIKKYFHTRIRVCVCIYWILEILKIKKDTFNLQLIFLFFTSCYLYELLKIKCIYRLHTHVAFPLSEYNAIQFFPEIHREPIFLLLQFTRSSTNYISH